jgi:hypothetical protein
LSLLAFTFAKDISVVYEENGDYSCYEKCDGPVENCPKVICPSEWEEKEKFDNIKEEADPVEGQFPGMDMMGFPGMMDMMGFPGMGGMGGFPGMGGMGGFPGMGGMGGFPGMGGMGGFPGMGGMGGFPGMGGMGGFPDMGGMGGPMSYQPTQTNACGCTSSCGIPCMPMW